MVALELWAGKEVECSKLSGNTEDTAEHSADNGSLDFEVSEGSKDYIRVIYVIFFQLRICSSDHLGMKNRD